MTVICFGLCSRLTCSCCADSVSGLTAGVSSSQTPKNHSAIFVFMGMGMGRLFWLGMGQVGYQTLVSHIFSVFFLSTSRVDQMVSERFVDVFRQVKSSGTDAEGVCGEVPCSSCAEGAPFPLVHFWQCVKTLYPW